MVSNTFVTYEKHIATKKIQLGHNRLLSKQFTIDFLINLPEVILQNIHRTLILF